VSGFIRAYARAEDAGPIWFVASNEGRMDDGLDLRMDCLDLGRFEANPVIGYGHSYWGRDSLPIGRAVDIEVDPPQLRLRVQFDDGDPFAAEVERKVRAGFLNAMSVGFDAYDVDRSGVPARWELFEASVVPLPMDPDALADLERKRSRFDPPTDPVVAEGVSEDGMVAARLALARRRLETLGRV